MPKSADEILHYSVQGNIALLSMDSPPVNGLGQPLRAALASAYQRALDDAAVDALVIASSTRLFCGGADISEFGTDAAFAEPALPRWLCALEASPKPVIAAINGAALGGGFELALACDYRIALPGARCGLPEVSLGILPGAGGTQRLPRLAGAELATEMIVSGKPRTAAELAGHGVIDRIVDAASAEEFVAAALAYAAELVEQGAGLRSCADLTVDRENLPEDFFATFRQSIARSSRGFYAPERCIQAVEAACELPLQQGLQREAELFRDCMDMPQARAQQHLFFAERVAARLPDVKPGLQPRGIERVAIIGSGTMGGGIAMNFLNAGIPTDILDLNAGALERGVETMRKNYAIAVGKGRLTEQQFEQRMSLLRPTTSYADLAAADLVIEAVFEDMAVKKSVFESLDAACRPGAILASNTSTLDIAEIAAVTSRPADVIGMHFFSPANVMQLLEVVRTGDSSPDALLTAIKLGQRIGKVPVVARLGWGFIGNRMLEPYGREAMRLVLEGAAPGQVDRVLQEFGLAMGFPSMIDLAGIDVGYLARQGHREMTYDLDPAYAAICDKLYALGRYGQKTGRGFYRYAGRDKTEDPEVLELAAQLAASHGVAQRQIGDAEILERCLYALVNEGAKVLQERVAARAGDIDVVYCYGYGFPRYRGGPMQYADEIGLDRVLEGLERYRRALGDYGETWFRPAQLLRDLAGAGRRFADFNSGA